MKLAIPFLDEAIEFNDDCLNTLVIEEQRAFRHIVQDIVNQTSGEEGESILSDNGKICLFSKRCEILSTFIPFEMNKKSIINHVLAVMERTALDEENFIRSQELLAQIEAFVYDLSLECDCELEFSKINIPSLLKTIGVAVKEEYDSLIEKIVDYMQMLCGFMGDMLFVTVNMRSYFTDDEISLFSDTVIGHKINVLMIENQEYPLLQQEKRIIIDKDICII